VTNEGPTASESVYLTALGVKESAYSLFFSQPNPHVACILVASDKSILGQGHTQPVGGPHAEVMALRNAAALGNSVVGATAYVTLEPCCHHGRTPPCCDALIAAGVRKVVVAIVDPNPLVAGKGIARLRAAGIEVEVGPGGAEARELNIGFFSRMIRKTPWVRMKIAASLDGKTALPDGQSQWITGEAARADGHAWRARSCAVLTGIGTVLADNPRLDVRLVATIRQPAVVIVDSRLDTPLDATILIATRTRIIYGAVPNDTKKAALEALGVVVVYLPGADGKVDLGAMLRDLGKREINELHVEAGNKLNGSLISAGLVDEFLVYLAPKLLGIGQGMATFGPIASLADAVELEFLDTAMVGRDVRLRARPVGRDQF
jgi:diaminohydroxyphosphoribosylaminopyrimidine deaminase / 5-amino-6-(5-phosphoribosylamino)uracil reductase